MTIYFKISLFLQSAYQCVFVFVFKFCQWRHFLGKKVYYKINWLLQICLTNDVKNNFLYNFGCSNRYETTSFPNYAMLTTKQGERIFLFLLSPSKRELNLKAVVKLRQNKKSRIFICQALQNDEEHGTAKTKLERLQFSTSSLFFKIWSTCSCEFKAYFFYFSGLYTTCFLI